MSIDVSSGVVADRPQRYDDRAIRWLAKQMINDKKCDRRREREKKLFMDLKFVHVSMALGITNALQFNLVKYLELRA